MSLLPTNKLSIYELIVVPKLIALLKGCQMWLYVRFTSSWSWLHLLVHLIGLSSLHYLTRSLLCREGVLALIVLAIIRHAAVK